MSTFRQFWGKLFSRSKEPTDADGQPTTSSEELEREILAIRGERQALAEAVQQVRSDFERARDEENRKIADLEQVRCVMERARDEDHRKLTELESLNSRFENAREADNRKILDLETRLAELESERNQARDKAQALENSLAETANRLEKTDLQVNNLQVNSVEQAKQVEASLSEANSRLEDTGNHVRELEDRLNSERQDYLNSLQEILGRFRKQDLRMNWTMSVAGAALLLGTVAGVILIWEMQRNAALLSGMSKDLKDLMSSIDGNLSLQHQPREEKQPLALPALPPPIARTTIAVQPEQGAAAKSQPVTPASKATISKPTLNPYYPGSEFKNRGRPTTREGKQDSTRGDANKFFEENAKVEGVVSLPSGVQYRVTKPGSGKSPTLSDKIVVAYVGTKLDGTVFDETYTTGTPSSFSMNELLPSWQEALLKMEEGAEFELYVPPNLSTKGGVRKRGVLGYEPSIYLIELLEVVREGAD